MAGLTPTLKAKEGEVPQSWRRLDPGLHGLVYLPPLFQQSDVGVGVLFEIDLTLPKGFDEFIRGIKEGQALPLDVPASGVLPGNSKRAATPIFRLIEASGSEHGC